MKTDFIYGKFINKDFCEKVINFFEDNHRIHRYDDKSNRSFSVMALKPFKFFKYFPEYADYLLDVLKDYKKKYEFSDSLQYQYALKQNIKIQKYKRNEGFYGWHYENNGHPDFSRLRHLVYMTYLNDVPDGGTEFLYQKKTLKAKKGYTCMWPAQWTHTHRGQVSKTREKYIITGWFSYVK